MTEENVSQAKPDAQFVLIVQDVNGVVEIAGVQEPEAFDGRFVSHVFGRWVNGHIEQLLRAAAADHKASEEESKVLTPERERTIILPENLS